METNSVKYLEIDSDLEQYIKGLNPDQIKLEHCKFIRHLRRKGLDMLPPWLFFEAVEQSPMAISITDKKANILYSNKAFSEVTGYTLKESIGQNESMLSYKSTPRHVYYELWHTVSRNKVWHGLLVNKHKHGEPYLADLTVAPLQDSSAEKTTNYLGIHRDISEQYQMEKKSHNQKLLIESVINSTSIAMVVLDEQNKVVLDNQEYKTLVSDLNHSEPAHLFMQLISVELGDVRQCLAENPTGINNLEVRLDNIPKNSPLWFSCSAKIFSGKDTQASSFFDESTQPYLLLSIADITRQRVHQEEMYLQSIKDMITEEEQIRSIRETLLGAIHQVSQPLNQIQAAIQLMSQKKQTGPLLDMLSELEKSCQESISTLKSCVPEIIPSAENSINLNRILHEVLMLGNNKFLRNGIVIEWKPASVLPSLIASENKLRMLFKQLIDNAVAAFGPQHKSERIIKVSTYANDKNIYVSITDNGPGIPLELRTKVFQPFYTTQKMGGIQAGMGLVMVKEIINQLSGSIEIDPEYTEGCHFIVSFPRT